MFKDMRDLGGAYL